MSKSDETVFFLDIGRYIKVRQICMRPLWLGSFFIVSAKNFNKDCQRMSYRKC